VPLTADYVGNGTQTVTILRGDTTQKLSKLNYVIQR
jgi:hypothetical protein